MKLEGGAQRVEVPPGQGAASGPVASLAIRGQVVRVVREGEPPPPGVDPNHEPGMGIRFLYADEAQRRAFEARIEELMIRTLGVRVASGLLGKEPSTE